MLKTSFTLKSYIHQEDGGAIYAAAQNLSILNCYFKKNSAYRGGAVFIRLNRDFGYQTIEIIKCIFIENEVGNSGACVYVGKIEQDFIGIIVSSFFFNNFALYRKFFFLFFLQILEFFI